MEAASIMDILRDILDLLVVEKYFLVMDVQIIIIIIINEFF